MTVATENQTPTRPPTRIACLLLITAVFWPPTVLQAANKKAQAATRVADTDDDFTLQGEYVGCLCYRGSIQRVTGLQISTQGDGRFRAVEYPGGLPGSGWNRRYKYEFEGQSENGKLFVASQNFTYTIDGRTAKVRSLNGHTAGCMTKTNRMSRTLGAKPPCRAVVLFDGSNVDHFKNGKITEDGHLHMGTELKQAYGAYHMHLEFRLPYMPAARGQGRANSGVYLQSRYEVQVLDSFSLQGEFNECGALYRYMPPRLNMCLPPLSWQTYDIYFQGPRFNDANKKIANARITVLHNGVVVHDDFPLERKTGAGKPEGSNPLPTKLQDHGNPVVYRNIWLVDYTDLLKCNPACLSDSLMFANLGVARPCRLCVGGSSVADASSNRSVVNGAASTKPAIRVSTPTRQRVRFWSNAQHRMHFRNG